MRFDFLCVVFCFILFIPQPAQSATITGRVVDASTTDALVGVNILIEGTQRGTFTNLDGQFRLDLPGETVSLRFSMIGYETWSQPVDTRQKATIFVKLKPTTLDSGEEISVVGKFPTLNKEPEVSAQYFEARELSGISGTVGDLTRTIQTLPGVVPQSDFTGKMYVRGGKAEENLVLLDRTFIYEPYHLAGLVSIFNPELIDEVEFYAGGFPAKYSQAMSSVLEVQNKIGARDAVYGNIQLDVINGNAVLSGPLLGEKGSWIASGRRSYQDKLMKAIGQFEDHILPSFYDYQAKLFYPLTDRHMLTVSTLFSGDFMDLEVTNPDSVLDTITSDGGRFYWKNDLQLTSLDWKFLFSENVFTHTTLSRVHQDFESLTTGADPDWVFANSTNFDLREDLTVLSIPRHKIEAGLYLFRSDVTFDMRWKQSIFLENVTENSNAGFGDERFETQFNRVYNYIGLYAQDTWDIAQPHLSISYGLRSDYLALTDDLVFSPRFSAAYRFDEQTVFKVATGIFRQFSRDAVQTDPTVGNPDLEAQKAIHYIAGVERKMSDNIKARFELFYKDLSNLTVIDTSINFANTGEGESYGFEFFVQKKLSGRLDGWASYTYAVSNRRDTPGGPTYNPLQDQRHTASLILNYRLGRGWRMSVKGTFYTGKPFTPITGSEPAIHADTGQPLTDPTTGFPIYVPVEGEINSDRFPAYHRLDVRFDRDFVFQGHDMSWYAEILNVYNYDNVFDYTYKYDYSERNTISQFPILPTVGIALRF